jgi:hypothetical protein
MEDLRYPIGPFTPSPALSAGEREAAILAIAAVPPALRAAVSGLSEEQLDTPYRDGGWTIRQVVHHLPDSHLNAYVRFKLAMTEEQPEIRPYDETAWAETEEARAGELTMSLDLLDHLHRRWVAFMRTLQPDDWSRGLRHPEFDRVLDLDFMLQLYAWHGAHHVAHIAGLRSRRGW